MYTLQLSKEQMQTLADVLARVGGCPHTTGRKYVDEITFKLENQGFEYISGNFKGELNAVSKIPYYDLKYVLDNPGFYYDGNTKYLSVSNTLFKVDIYKKLVPCDLRSVENTLFFVVDAKEFSDE